MADPLQAIFDEPELLEALRRWDPEGEFAPPTVRRAHGYLAPGVISKLKVQVHADDDDGYGPLDDCITVSAKVLGSARRPYTTSVDFLLSGITDAWEAESYCSCPVGYRCKHSAALMMHLSSLARQSAANGGTPSAKQLPRIVTEWLRSLETAANPAPPAPAKPKAPSQEKFLACCLDTARSGKLRFVLHPASRSKNGKVRIEASETRTDLANPPKYVADEDLRICIAYRRHPKESDGWSSDLIPQGRERRIRWWAS